MSQQARELLVNSGHLIFQKPSQKTDLETVGVTQTGLIGLLLGLTNKGWYIELTAVKSDHGNDAGLGEHCHFNGYCADGWPLASATPGDYLDAHDPRFAQFLEDLSESPFLHQVGLAGSADCAADLRVAGPTAFEDEGADHIHLGALNP